MCDSTLKQITIIILTTISGICYKSSELEVDFKSMKYVRYQIPKLHWLANLTLSHLPVDATFYEGEHLWSIEFVCVHTCVCNVRWISYLTWLMLWKRTRPTPLLVVEFRLVLSILPISNRHLRLRVGRRSAFDFQLMDPLALRTNIAVDLRAFTQRTTAAYHVKKLKSFVLWFCKFDKDNILARILRVATSFGLAEWVYFIVVVISKILNASLSVKLKHYRIK